MLAVSVMHEQMHQRTKQQGQKHECAKQMSAMLHPQVGTADGQKAD
jgi:hypothetical protein